LTDPLDLSNEFDLRGRVYLDGANQGPMGRRAIAAVERALDWKRDPSQIDDATYFALPDRIRGAASELFGCRPQDIAVATGASHGISLVACGLDWGAGDRVVIPSGEFPANNLPWQGLRTLGVEVEVVEPGDVLTAICARTRVVSVGHVNFSSGRLGVETNNGLGLNHFDRESVCAGDTSWQVAVPNGLYTVQVHGPAKM